MKKFLFAFVAALLLVGCGKETDNSALEERVGKLERQQQELLEMFANLNSQVSGLASTVKQWQDGGFVTKIERTLEGFTVWYLDGTTVTLTLEGAKGDKGDTGETGPKGDKGDAPVISVQYFNDGLYWTVNGEFLVVGGNYVPVNVVPLFNIDANGHLIATIGEKSQDLGPVVGSGAGDSLIKSIVADDDEVVLTLVNGQTFSIPMAKAFRLEIAKTVYDLIDKPLDIPYTVKNRTEETVVDVWNDANYKAKVDGSKITVTPPAEPVEGSILAFADSRTGLTSIVKINFIEGGEPVEPETFEVNSGIDYAVAAAGGVVEVSGISNVAFTVNPKVDWITYKETKAEAFTVVLEVAANTAAQIREGSVELLRASDQMVLATVKIAQAAAAEPTFTVADIIGQADGTPIKTNEVLVMAKTTRGVVIAEGGKAIYAYGNSLSDVNVGDIVVISATKKTYNGVPELDPIASVNVVGTGNGVVYPEPKDVTAEAGTYKATEAEFISLTGTLAVSGNYYNLTIDGVDANSKQGSIVYPVDELNAKSFDGKKITVTGYFNGLSSKDKYLNIITVKIKEAGEAGGPSEEYLADDNLWKPVDANHTIEAFYNPGWAGEKEAPAMTQDQSTYTVTIPDACPNDWNVQYWIMPTNELKLDITKKYSLKFTVSASTAGNFYAKLYHKGVDGAFSCETNPRIALAAGEEVVVEIKDFIPIETPQNLLFDLSGHDANTTFTIKDIILKQTGELPPAVEWDYTPSEEYLAANNLWKPIDDGKFVKYFHTTSLDGWVAHETTDPSFMTWKESTRELKYEAGTPGRWENQFFMYPFDQTHFLALDAAKTYKIKLTLGATTNFNCFFKLLTYNADAAPKCEGALIWEAGEVALKNTEPTVLEHEFTGVSCDNINFIFDFGTNPSNTTVYIKDITLVDLSQPVVQAPKNIAEIIAAIPETATASGSAAEFDVDLENPVVVSYMIKSGNNWNIYLEDETAGILLYLPENPGIQPGVTLKGKFTVKAYRYKGLPEIVSLSYTTAPTFGQTTVPCTEVTISELLANYDKYMLRKCKIVGVTVTDGIADGDRNGEIAQGDAKIAVYAQLNNQGLVLNKDAQGDLVCIPGIFNTTKQVYFWQNDWFIASQVPPQPAAPKNIAEIIAALPETATGSNTAAEFDVDLENPVVVSYMIKDGSNKWNIYLEDETAGILLYLPENPGIQPGVTLKGKFTVKAYRYKGLPEIVSLAYTENPTWGQAAVPCTEVTISELLATYDKYMLRKCKIVGVTVTDGIADGDRNGEIAQGDAKIAVYAQLNNQGLVLNKDAQGDLVCIPGIFNTTKQVYFWQNDWFIPGQADEGGSNVPDYDPITGFEW